MLEVEPLVINLDAEPLEEILALKDTYLSASEKCYGRGEHECSKVYWTLSRYCKFKAGAIQSRLDGKIDNAIRLEKACQLTYDCLPKRYRW